jgi:hypothetical protein
MNLLRTTSPYCIALTCLIAAASLYCMPATCRADETAGNDIPIADFESAGYGDWKATGTAFKAGPARGALPAKLEIENYVGNGVASSEIEGDGPTGTLTSPEFKIERRYISFRIGGGK